MGPAVWRGPDLARSRDWVQHLTPSRLDELDAAVRAVRTRGTPLLKVTAEHFPLPGLAEDLARAADELENGRGFVLVRGIPVEGYGPAALGVLLWGLGRHLGIPVSQNTTGHMLGRTGTAEDGREDLAAQALHTDEADAVALLCLRKTRTALTSSAAVHNAVRAHRPELLDSLYRTHFLVHEEPDPPQVPCRAVPLAHRDGERFSLRYDRRRLESAQHRADVPRLSPAEVELFDLIDAAAHSPDLRLDLDLAPGDLLLLNSHAVLHSLTAPAPVPARAPGPQALRLWLTPHRPRTLPRGFWGDAPSAAGGRGGVAPLDVITPQTPTTRKPHDRAVRTPGPIRPVPR
ncbi:TauD/TfdA family dioxygenase [Streptomyces laculatispora]|uniref:TauD/TfdA family dioxygenase n=1 Tax=Streptomyces laculatispora TaxID=887464 RepID=UPI001A93D62F|nr:TauD/TfdA family dioxygenase [Streptomyces laculatispora]MBO0914790.1 TauD/TfdA family dioxygenase [Streptomyces laculatispora]